MTDCTTTTVGLVERKRVVREEEWSIVMDGDDFHSRFICKTLFLLCYFVIFLIDQAAVTVFTWPETYNV